LGAKALAVRARSEIGTRIEKIERGLMLFGADEKLEREGKAFVAMEDDLARFVC